jgi:hypothetical protein
LQWRKRHKELRSDNIPVSAAVSGLMGLPECQVRWIYPSTHFFSQAAAFFRQAAHSKLNN